MYFLEGGALFCVPLPATQHDFVERVWTQHRLRQVDLNDRNRDVTGVDLLFLDIWGRGSFERCIPVFSGL